jgi:hypothetical protein
MTQNVLLITTIDGAENCASAIAERVGSAVLTAETRRGALDLLRAAEFAVVVVEESLAESDPAWADSVWEAAGYAVPLQVNFSISGTERLTREIKAALARRAGEQALARKAVAHHLENELKSSLTGLLLQSELALREPSMPASLAPKLQHVVELAGAIRERLRSMEER